VKQSDKQLLESVWNKSFLFDWWREFVENIARQGWMSDKQREKLQSFNYQAELTRGYSYKGITNLV